MGMNLKALLDSVALQTGILAPPQWFGSNNESDQQLIAFAQAVLRNQREKLWTAQLQEAVLTPTLATLYSVPDDFLCYVPDTMWQNGMVWPVTMPTGNSDWAYLQSISGPVGVTIKARFRSQGGKYLIELWNPQGALLSPGARTGTPIRYQYFSRNLVQPVLGLVPAGAPIPTQEYFQKDSDTCVLDDDLVISDILWRYRKAKGFDDWQADRQAYLQQLNTVRARDRGAATIQPPSYWTREPYANLWVTPP